MGSRRTEHARASIRPSAIHLSAANAETFREAVSPFLNAAATKVAPGISAGPPARPPQVHPLRYQVAPADVIGAYAVATWT